MFSTEIIHTDRFLSLSKSAQLLYFHLGLYADDDGFISSPRTTIRITGCNDDDFRELVLNGFVYPFPSGVVCIADWKINNTIQSDRYHKTIHTDEKELLTVLPNKRYEPSAEYSCCIQNVSRLETACIQNGIAD